MIEAWIIIVAAILFSGFFSGMEMAFVSANKYMLEIDKSKPGMQGKLLTLLTKEPSRYIGTMLIGNNIILVIYGMATVIVLEPWISHLMISWWGEVHDIWLILLQTILSTIVILVTGEFLPKAFFAINPNQSLRLFLIPATIFYYLLHLPVSFTVFVSKRLLKYVFRVNMHEADVSFERTDLDYYLSQVSFDELVEKERLDNEVKILQNVLEFPLTRARKCMVPRTEIVAIEINAPIEELIKLFIETGHSKIMVYRDSIDEIVGFVHSFEIFKNPSTIREAMLSAVIVPETMLVKDILALLTQQHKSVAVVVDEYGGTSGMLTTEDIIEEIFGEIEDEHDSQDLIEKVNEDGTFLFSGRLKIDYINDTYSLNLPQRLEYTTLAGLILDLEKSIPKIGQTIEIEGFRFIIQRVSDTKIEEVIINPIKS